MASNPYADPSLVKRVLRRIVGREREVRAVIAALAAGRNVLLQGPPGTSKSTLLRIIAEETGIKFFIVEGSADLTPQKLVGMFNPARVMAEGFRREFFEPGPLTKAMIEGGILYIEEFNRMSEEAANVLIRASEEGELSVPRLGVVRAKPSFRIVCAMNPYDDVGTSRVSRALMDRFVMLRMDYQSRDEELRIVELRSGSKRRWLVELAVDVARATRSHPAIRMGSSVRGAIDMVKICEQLILMRGALSLEDIMTAAIMAFTPKIWLKDSSRNPEEVVEEIVRTVIARKGFSENPLQLEEDKVSRGAEHYEEDCRGVEHDELRGIIRMAEVAPRRIAVEISSNPQILDMLASKELGGLDAIARVYPYLSPQARDLAKRYARDIIVRFTRSAFHGRRGLVRRRYTDSFTDIDVEASVERILENCGFMLEDLIVFSRGGKGEVYALIIDRSSSMAGFKLVLGALTAATLAYASRKVDDYCVLAFNTEVDVMKPLKVRMSVEELAESILSLKAFGYTNIHKALIEAYSMMSEYGYDAKAVLITDGEWTAGENPLKAAPLFKELNVLCVPSKWIGFAKALAELGNGNFAFIRSLREIPSKLGELMGLMI